MTFDLHYPNDVKAAAYKNWVKRVYVVASTLNLSYLELWELPEQEFLVLEEIALEMQQRAKEQKEEIMNQRSQSNAPGYRGR